MIALGIFSVVSLVVKLPCIWIALAMAKEEVISWGFTWTMLSGVIGLGEGALLQVLFGPGPNWWETTTAMCLGHTAMAVTMICVLYVLRSFGYSMSRVRKRNPIPVAEA